MSIRLYRVFLWPLLSDGASQEASGHLLKSSKENVKWILAGLLQSLPSPFKPPEQRGLYQSDKRIPVWHERHW